MYIEEAKISDLAKLLLNYDYVFIDTCSLMHDKFPYFMDRLVAAKEYRKDNFHFVLPEECINELENHSKDKSDMVAFINAKTALKIIKHDEKKEKTMEVFKKISDNPFADAAITSHVVTLRPKARILVITQDKTLTDDLKNLKNSLASQKGYPIDVMKLDNDGVLVGNLGNQSVKKARTLIKKEPKIAPKTVEKVIQKIEKPKTFDPLTEEIIKEDRLLSARLPNSTYPLNKKVEDIRLQLSRLKGKKEPLNLAYTVSELEKKLKEFENKVASNHKAMTLVQPKEETAPIQQENKGMREEIGSSSKNAIERLLIALNIIPHDKTVPYVKEVHGFLNVTLNLLDDLAEKCGTLSIKGSQSFPFGDYLLMVARITEDKYKATLYKLPPKKPLLPPAPKKVTKEVEVKKDVEEKKAVTKKGRKPEVPSEKLTLALKNEKNLRSNLTNQTYAVKNKIKDLEAQIALLHELTPSERTKVTLKLSVLKKNLKDFQNK